MAGSNIPDIASDPEKGILKVTSVQFLCTFVNLAELFPSKALKILLIL